MTLPELRNWDATRDTLHQIALVLGAIRVACVDPLPNDLQFSVDVTASGLSTSDLKTGGQLHFDLSNLRLSYERDDRTLFAIDPRGHTQKSLLATLLEGFAAQGSVLEPSLKHIEHDTEFEIDRDTAADYQVALSAVYTALAHFRAKLSGFMSPLVLWPHHFDLGFLWFPGGGMDEHKDAQMSFGFAPNSPGLLRPYFYAYSWSPNSGYVQVPLQPPAQAISEGYTGLYAAYDDLRSAPDFSSVVETMLMVYQRAALARL